MYKEILYTKQLDIIKILKVFSKDFYLAGGTAIALQLGHRKSLDFDLFSHKKISSTRILNKLKSEGFDVNRTLVDNKTEELTLIVEGVKVTFLYYPFSIKIDKNFTGIGLPDIITLGAMKFYTLGRRGKCKDYVDIYHILKSGYNFDKISSLAEQTFTGGYNEKLLREQLCYYKDVDYSEEVEYLSKTVEQSTIQQYLIEIAKQ